MPQFDFYCFSIQIFYFVIFFISFYNIVTQNYAIPFCRIFKVRLKMKYFKNSKANSNLFSSYL